MTDRLLLYGLIYPVAAAAILTVLAIIMGRRVSILWLWSIATAGLAISVVRLIYLESAGAWGTDHRIFWKVGQDIWHGIDPYLPERYSDHPFLNPPSTFPIFALFAGLPFQTSLVIWSFLYTALSFGMVWLAQRALMAQDQATAPRLSNAELGALATAFGLSDACMATIHLGQLSLLTTALLLVAIWAQGRKQPVLAGAALGLATMKVSTMLPFLLFFSPKRDYRTWIALAVTVVLLIILGGQAPNIFDHVRAMLHHIGELSQPGRVNDISYAGPYHESIFGIDHLAYRLGLRQRIILFSVNGVALLTLGVWLARQIVGLRISRPLGIALVSLYSVIFLYHRLYDMVMIVPALLYAVSRAKERSGRERVLLVIAVISMLAVLYLRRNTLDHLTDWAVVHKGFFSSVVEILVLPYGTWLILLALICLRLAGDGFEDKTRCSSLFSGTHATATERSSI